MYIYQALIESSQETVMPCSQLRQTFDELCREDKVAEQFEVCISIVSILFVAFIHHT